ncbi:DUF488 domain-containing protein [Pseudoxanthomonas mexicana]|uniref:DUF488 domain-containing protein n=1 Tax=Pseudoxanthomonas mexicana TaxID=128785 RepID=UPI00398A82BF
MDIRLKRAYEPAEDGDGERFLVDRLWPRGVSKQELQAIWLKEVAPSPGLRQWFGHRPERWDGFRQRYRKELDAADEALEPLRQALAAGPVTLVYGARDTRHNGALVLREHLLGHGR